MNSGIAPILLSPLPKRDNAHIGMMPQSYVQRFYWFYCYTYRYI